MSQSPTLRIAAAAALVIVASIGSRPVRAQPAARAMSTVSAVADSFLVDSMMVFGGRPRPMAEAYADRHAATPGQLATYFIGFNEITSARNETEQRLGAAFRLPEFNREVLRDGTITLSSMRAKMARWNGARSRTTATQ